MLLILPLVTFVLLWLLVARHRTRLGMGELSVRGALVLAFLGFELVVLLVAYGLSFFDQFTRGAVVGAWSLALVVLLWVARRPMSDGLASVGDRTIRARWRHDRIQSLGTEDWIWLVVLAVIVVLIATVAFTYLPSSSDGLNYHLVRVEHWIQDRSIAPYATHYLPQVEFGPLAEYNIAHVRLLTGTDRMDALVELGSMVICLVGASELARLLGGSLRTQIAAAVVCATIPSGVLLASSTENNYFAAAVAVTLLVVILTFSFRTAMVKKSVILGLTAGTAYVTKAIVPALVLPTAAIFLGYALVHDVPTIRHRRRAWAGRIGLGLGAAVLAGAVVVLPFAVPLEQLDGALFGGPTSSAATSRPLTVQVGAANIVRNVANEFHIGNGHSGVGFEVSRTVLPALGSIFNALNIPADNPRFAVTPEYSAFAVGNYSNAVRSEERAANPLQLLLIVVATIVLIVAVARRSPRSRRPFALAVGLAGGYALFTATAKWGLWDIRYDLPLFVAWSAVIAVALARSSAWILRVTLAVLVVACLPQLLDNINRPLVGKHAPAASNLSGYLSDCCKLDPTATGDNFDSVATVLTQSSCREVSLTNSIEFEYLLWAGLRQHGWTGHVDDTDVDNYTSPLESHHPACATVSEQPATFRTPDDGNAWMQFGNLAVSLRPSAAASVRRNTPKFSSTAPGIKVFAGAGWSLTGYGALPILGQHGSVYLVSNRSAQINLNLAYPPGTQAPITAELTDGTSLASHMRGSSEVIGVPVRPGETRVDLTVSPESKSQPSAVVLRSVSAAPTPKG